MGSVVMLGASVWLYHIIRLVQLSDLTKGKIIDLINLPSLKGDTAYTLVIDFTDSNGQTHRFNSEQTQSSRNKIAHKPGQLVNVLYPGYAPLDARIYSPFSMWFFPLTLFLLGFTLITVLGVIPLLQIDDTTSQLYFTFADKSPPARVDLNTRFAAKVPPPYWWTQVITTDENLINNAQDVRNHWSQTKKVGIEAKQMYKDFYQAILMHDNEELTPVTVYFMMQLSCATKKARTALAEYATTYYFHYKNKQEDCINCKPRDIMAQIVYILANNHRTIGKHSYSLKLLSQLLTDSADEISDQIKADLYNIMAKTWWDLGEKVKARNTIDKGLSNIATTIPRRHLLLRLQEDYSR